MANAIKYKDSDLKIGDTLSIDYIIKEGNKERRQVFRGILLRIKGSTAENKMITVRKITRSGVGVERIIPLFSPYIAGIKVVKTGKTRRSKIYFVRGLSEQDLRRKLYHKK